MSDLIDRESAIEAISDIVSTVSVCATSDEAMGKARMKEMAIEALREEKTVEAIPVKWIVDNYIKSHETGERKMAMVAMIFKWREENR
jgi:hypothetical protein